MESSERDDSHAMTASEACAAGLICNYCWRALTPDGKCCPRRQEAEACVAMEEKCVAGGGRYHDLRDTGSPTLEPQASKALEPQAVSDASHADGEDGEGSQEAWSPGPCADEAGGQNEEVPREFRMCQRAPHWTCPQCGRSNWRTRLACQRCDQPHPAQASHQGVLVEEALSRQEQEQAATDGPSSEHPAVRRIREKAASRSQGGSKQWTPQQWKEWNGWKRQRRGSAATGPSARRPATGPSSV